MDFNTKSSNIIIVIFQMKVIFNNMFFFNTFMLIWMNNLSKCFLWNHMSDFFQLQL
jgi:hypothetical protein